MLWTELERGYRDMWREFDRLNRLLSRGLQPASAEFPAANVWVSGEHAVVTTEIPGVSPEDMEISVSGKLLTLRGERKPEEVAEGSAYHRRERWNGKFSRTFELPFTVDAGKVDARFSKGVLRVTLPQVEAEKPRKISVMAA